MKYITYVLLLLIFTNQSFGTERVSADRVITATGTELTTPSASDCERIQNEFTELTGTQNRLPNPDRQIKNQHDQPLQNLGELKNEYDRIMKQYLIDRALRETARQYLEGHMAISALTEQNLTSQVQLFEHVDRMATRINIYDKALNQTHLQDSAAKPCGDMTTSQCHLMRRGDYQLTVLAASGIDDVSEHAPYLNRLTEMIFQSYQEGGAASLEGTTSFLNEIKNLGLVSNSLGTNFRAAVDSCSQSGQCDSLQTLLEAKQREATQQLSNLSTEQARAVRGLIYGDSIVSSIVDQFETMGERRTELRDQFITDATAAITQRQSYIRYGNTTGSIEPGRAARAYVTDIADRITSGETKEQILNALDIQLNEKRDQLRQIHNAIKRVEGTETYENLDFTRHELFRRARSQCQRELESLEPVCDSQNDEILGIFGEEEHFTLFNGWGPIKNRLLSNMTNDQASDLTRDVDRACRYEYNHETTHPNGGSVTTVTSAISTLAPSICAEARENTRMLNHTRDVLYEYDRGGRVSGSAFQRKSWGELIGRQFLTTGAKYTPDFMYMGLVMGPQIDIMGIQANNQLQWQYDMNALSNMDVSFYTQSYNSTVDFDFSTSNPNLFYNPMGSAGSVDIWGQ